MDYHQPSFYHFSEDSIELAKLAFKQAQFFECVLDLGCGCGVIGMEFAALKGESSFQLDGVDIESSYEDFFKTNARSLDLMQTCFTQGNFFKLSELGLKSTYDVIFLNPPYYDIFSSRRSLDLKTDRAKRMDMSQLEQLASEVKKKMSSESDFFLCHKTSTNVFEKFVQCFSVESVHVKKKTSYYHLKL